MSPFRLLKEFSLPYYKNEKGKNLLGFIGLIIGVAVYVSIRISTTTAIESFESAGSIVSGDDILDVSTDAGRISEDFYPKIRQIDELEIVTPYSSRKVKIKSDKSNLNTVQIVGLDIFNLPNKYQIKNNSEKASFGSITELLEYPKSVLVSAELYNKINQEKVKLLVNGEETQVNIAGIISEDPGHELLSGLFILCDISIFQNIFSDYGVIDSFKVKIKDAESAEKVKQIILRESGPNSKILEANELADTVKKMSLAFRTNLTFLAGISLLVSTLLIYNISSFNFLRRRKDFGVVLSIGCRQIRLFKLLLYEALFIGITGSIIGIMFGYLLSCISLDLVLISFSNLYQTVTATSPVLTPGVVIEGLIFGTLAVVTGSILPLLELFNIPLKSSFGYQTFELRFSRTVPKYSFAALVCFCLSIFFAKKELLELSIYFGFISPLFLILSSILISPLFLLFVSTSLRTFISNKNYISVLLAVDHVLQTLRRNSMAVASIVVAVAMGLGLSIMIASFRGSVESWIFSITKADLYISYSSQLNQETGIPEADTLIADLGEHELVRDIDWFGSRLITFKDNPLKVVGTKFDIIKKYDRLVILSEKEPKKSDNYSGIYISETASNKHSIKAGDLVSFSGIEGEEEFYVRYIFKDFSSEQGVFIIPYNKFSSMFKSELKEGISIYVKDEHSVEKFTSYLVESHDRSELMIRNNSELRSEVLSIFDQTFLITRMLRYMVAFLAFCIVITNVSMLLFERKREFLILRAIGSTKSMLLKTIIIESTIIGLSGFILGCLVGIALSLLLVFVVNAHFFGWTLEYAFNYLEILSIGIMVFISAVLAGLIPTMGGNYMDNKESIRYE